MGWDGDDNVPCNLDSENQQSHEKTLHLHTWSVLRKSWDGVGSGWGGKGMIMFLALAYMVGAT